VSPIRKLLARSIGQRSRRSSIIPGAGLRQSRARRYPNHSYGVKGTIADIVEVGSRLRELGGNLSMESQDIPFGIKPPGHPRLISNDKDEES
jgi:hypothetical protein